MPWFDNEQVVRQLFFTPSFRTETAAYVALIEGDKTDELSLEHKFLALSFRLLIFCVPAKCRTHDCNQHVKYDDLSDEHGYDEVDYDQFVLHRHPKRVCIALLSPLQCHASEVTKQ